MTLIVVHSSLVVCSGSAALTVPFFYEDHEVQVVVGSAEESDRKL